MNEDLKLQIQGKVACEERAHHHVEQLVLSDSISRTQLQDVVNQIMPGHYADIIEERSISRMCGYPLCQNSLIKVPKQKFHISMKQNKVYNIAERKFFCNKFCYKASKLLASQIPVSPLWLRKDNFVKVEFLEESEKIETSEDSREELLQTRPPVISSSDPLVDVLTENFVMLHSLPSPQNEETEETFENPYFQRDEYTPVFTSRASCLIEPVAQRTSPFTLVDIEKLCLYLQKWCTDDTFKLLSLSSSDDKNFSDQENNSLGEMGPLDTKKHRSQQKSKFAQKFIETNAEWQTERSSNNENERLHSKAFVAPLIDSKSQQTIRRRIVSQKLKHGILEVSSELQLSVSDFKIDIASLVKSFRFTSQNITLKATEWKLMSAALLNGFAFQDSSLASLLNTRANQFDEILQACNISKAQFEKLVQILKTNLDMSDSYSFTGDVNIYDNDSLD